MVHRRLAPASALFHPHQQSSSQITATSSFQEVRLSSTTSLHASSPPPSKTPVEFSPPLIAMVVIIVTAFVIIAYSRLLSRHFLHNYRRYRRWRLRRRVYAPSSSAGDIESRSYSFDHSDAFRVLSPYGLDDSIIKAIPLSAYIVKSGFHDCAVCLIEFEEDDYVRTLPVCSHAFHVDCIDIWLRSHPNCPLCRAGIFRQESPFTPLMAARIRPSLDEILFTSTILEPLAETPIEAEVVGGGEITQEPSPRRRSQSEDRCNRRDFLLKRSYSFGFERDIESERLVLEQVTASPWRYRRALGVGGGFWSKRSSPFTALTKHTVFSSRYYRGMKSPFFRRRSIGSFFTLSDSSFRTCLSSGGGVGGSGCSSRRSKSFASPMFLHRSSGGTTLFSPSRMRSGDPEAIVSPERLIGRRHRTGVQ